MHSATAAVPIDGQLLSIRSDSSEDEAFYGKDVRELSITTARPTATTAAVAVSGTQQVGGAANSTDQRVASPVHGRRSWQVFAPTPLSAFVVAVSVVPAEELVPASLAPACGPLGRSNTYAGLGNAPSLTTPLQTMLSHSSFSSNASFPYMKSFDDVLLLKHTAGASVGIRRASVPPGISGIGGGGVNRDGSRGGGGGGVDEAVKSALAATGGGAGGESVPERVDCYRVHLLLRSGGGAEERKPQQVCQVRAEWKEFLYLMQFIDSVAPLFEPPSPQSGCPFPIERGRSFVQSAGRSPFIEGGEESVAPSSDSSGASGVRASVVRPLAEGSTDAAGKGGGPMVSPSGRAGRRGFMEDYLNAALASPLVSGLDELQRFVGYAAAVRSEQLQFSAATQQANGVPTAAAVRADSAPAATTTTTATTTSPQSPVVVVVKGRSADSAAVGAAGAAMAKGAASRRSGRSAASASVSSKNSVRSGSPRGSRHHSPRAQDTTATELLTGTHDDHAATAAAAARHKKRSPTRSATTTTTTAAAAAAAMASSASSAGGEGGGEEEEEHILPTQRCEEHGVTDAAEEGSGERGLPTPPERASGELPASAVAPCADAEPVIAATATAAGGGCGVSTTFLYHPPALADDERAMLEECFRMLDEAGEGAVAVRHAIPFWACALPTGFTQLMQAMQPRFSGGGPPPSARLSPTRCPDAIGEWGAPSLCQTAMALLPAEMRALPPLAEMEAKLNPAAFLSAASDVLRVLTTTAVVAGGPPAIRVLAWTEAFRVLQYHRVFSAIVLLQHSEGTAPLRARLAEALAKVNRAPPPTWQPTHPSSLSTSLPARAGGDSLDRANILSAVAAVLLSVDNPTINGFDVFELLCLLFVSCEGGVRAVSAEEVFLWAAGQRHTPDVTFSFEEFCAFLNRVGEVLSFSELLRCLAAANPSAPAELAAVPTATTTASPPPPPPAPPLQASLSAAAVRSTGQHSPAAHATQDCLSGGGGDSEAARCSWSLGQGGDPRREPSFFFSPSSAPPSPPLWRQQGMRRPRVLGLVSRCASTADPLALAAVQSCVMRHRLRGQATAADDRLAAERRCLTAQRSEREAAVAESARRHCDMATAPLRGGAVRGVGLDAADALLARGYTAAIAKRLTPYRDGVAIASLVNTAGAITYDVRRDAPLAGPVRPAVLYLDFYPCLRPTGAGEALVDERTPTRWKQRDGCPSGLAIMAPASPAHPDSDARRKRGAAAPFSRGSSGGGAVHRRERIALRDEHGRCLLSVLMDPTKGTITVTGASTAVGARVAAPLTPRSTSSLGGSVTAAAEDPPECLEGVGSPALLHLPHAAPLASPSHGSCSRTACAAPGQWHRLRVGIDWSERRFHATVAPLVDVSGVPHPSPLSSSPSPVIAEPAVLDTTAYLLDGAREVEGLATVDVYPRTALLYAYCNVCVMFDVP